ncbi:hypothetical protein QJS10_CPB12g00852 [Acorus calamus]|uniref:PH domain-containing protein n=1 Tax=Acorus calamus TaxID=4465 RepID=A0AAV9DQ49_ACOCL|nr:hypothetical protein QJS10_CPB12g00852 [Acorus calamus]
MDEVLGKIKIFPHHFEASVPDDPQTTNSTASQLRSHNHMWIGKKLTKAASMLNVFHVPGLPWSSGTSNDDKVELTVAEVEALRTEITDAEDREAQLKAKLELLDELLRSARFVGYLYIRTRWTALPGEPPIDDTDVDDWLPRFLVLHGSCIFYYLNSTDLSPQDSTLLSDVTEVGSAPSFLQEDQQTRYSFYILTSHGLRIECSSLSKVQVDAWLGALQTDCRSQAEMIDTHQTTNQ